MNQAKILATICLFLLSGLTHAQTGSALHFDGTNDYVSVGVPTNLPVANQSFTVEAWINPDTMPTTSESMFGIVGWGSFVVNGMNFLSLYNSTGTAGIRSWWHGNDLEITTADLSNTWHHVAITYDGTNRKILLDGLVIASDNPPGGHNTTASGSLKIGYTTYSPQEFPGKMDEVRIWDYARCPAEIIQYMNCELSGSETGLVAYYKFNQGIAGANNAGVNALTDLSPNGNNGSLFNFALNGSNSNWISPGGVINGIVCIPTTPPELDMYGNGLLISNGDFSVSMADGTDFGFSIQCDSITRTFVLINSGNIDLIIDSVYLTGGGTNFITNLSSSTVNPGDTAMLIISFVPTLSGGSGAVVNVISNACSDPQYLFGINAYANADNIPPTAICQNITVYLDTMGYVMVDPMEVDNGSNDPCGIMSYSLYDNLFDCSDVGINPDTLVIMDVNGNYSECSALITVADTLSPVPDTSSLPPLYAICTLNITNFPIASDNCNSMITGTTTDPLTYGPGNYNITWNYNDGHGNIVTQIQQVIVDSCSSVEDIHQLSFKIYPNPSSGYVTMEIPKLFSDGAELQVMNCVGQIMHNSKIFDSLSILNFAELPNGIYLVNLKSGSKISSIRLVILSQM